MKSLFESVEQAPRDPIFGLNEQFNADTRENKVNLGVGVYCDDAGRLPLLQAVHKAELALVQAGAARGYLPIEGIPGYNKGAQAMLFGQGSTLAASGRVLTAQALGGTGALNLGADFLKRLLPESHVVISDPSWENHRALFERAGFQVDNYPYYDDSTNGLNFDAMSAYLEALPEQTIVVLHACCHNPTGIDPTSEQWKQIAQIVQKGNLVPFFDIAYQGFGEGLEQDASVIRLFADMDMTMVISSSFSKSFSLYGERVGALTLVSSSAEESSRVLSQLKRVIRTNYSTPPTHGAKIVAEVLNTPELYALWEEELSGMRERIRTMRVQLTQKLQEHGAKKDFSFVLNQRGMFSYSGLSVDQVDRLRDDYGIYAISTGRICIAALNSGNIDYVARSIAAVIA